MLGLIFQLHWSSQVARAKAGLPRQQSSRLVNQRVVQSGPLNV